MLAWHLWLMAALLLLLAELLGTGFFAFAMGLAALVAMVAALLGAGSAVQWFSGSASPWPPPCWPRC